MIEADLQGVYNFSRLDKAISILSPYKKYLRVRIEDRTFWGSKFVPSYVQIDSSYQSSKTFFATIWNGSTMDAYIDLVSALVRRYKSNPWFSGIALEETAIGATSFKADPKLYLDLYSQLKRFYLAVHEASPDTLITQLINWPYQENESYLDDLAQALDDLGGGGSIGWPDSILGEEYKWSWYQTGRDFRNKVVIAAEIQSPNYPPGTNASFILSDAMDVYNMLVNDIGANIIVWDTWNEVLQGEYFQKISMVVVDAHPNIPNTKCPFPPTQQF